MKIKIGIVILIAVCLGLLIALVATKKASDEQVKTDVAHILDFSNQLVTAHTSIDDLNQVNLMLTNDLVTVHQTLMAVSNNLTETSSVLSDTKASLENAQGQITNLNLQIGDLEVQNQALDARSASLSNTIAALDLQIADTKQKLSTSDTNNVFLTAELQKQMAQKAELERQFNDLDAVRAQVKKLRNELFVARRLEWINNGTTPGNQMKGAQLLMQRPDNSTTKTAGSHSPQYDLNVEVGSDGSVHVLPPATNSPAH